MSTKAARFPPEPPGPPIMGHVFRALKDPIGLMTEASRLDPEVSRLRFGPTFLYHVLSGPSAIRHVLQTHAKNYVKSRNYDGVKFVLGQGLLTSEGDFWKRQRRLAQPAFHATRLPAIAATMAKLAVDHVARWKDGELYDMHADMMRLTLRIVGQTLFGADLEGEADPIGGALDVAIHWAQAYAEQFVRLPPWVPTPTNLRFRRALATLDRLVYKILADRRAGGRDGDDLLGMFMAVRDADTGEAMSDRQLRDETMTLILAGHETTANALSFALHLLSHHPEVAARLQRELDAELGGRAPGFDDLPRLPFTGRVVDESMRLYPPAWCFERQAVADDEIAGYTIPADAMVAVCPYLLHRDPRFWDDPERFDPDRFLPARSEGRPKEAYLPFGDGPRVCIGKAFAQMEAKIILATVMQRVRLEPTLPLTIGLEPGITLRPREGMPLRLHARSAPTTATTSEAQAERAEHQ